MSAANRYAVWMRTGPLEGYLNTQGFVTPWRENAAQFASLDDAREALRAALCVENESEIPGVRTAYPCWAGR